MSEQTAKPSSANHSHPLAKNKSKPRCAHFTSTGRGCRLPVLDARSGLCFRHFQLSQSRFSNTGHLPTLDPDATADELLIGVEDFSKPDSVNLFLGNLVKQLAYKRIARPDAIAMAYVCQLILNSFPAMHKQFEEARYTAGEREIFETLRRSYAARAQQSETPEANPGTTH
jgi:hypothetical protein